MYELNDTITAISSGATTGARQIIRISGTKALQIANELFTPAIKQGKKKCIQGSVCFDAFELDCFAYYFPEGTSYTGDELIELHVCTSLHIAEEILKAITANTDTRLANAGEFTARAYLNGKIDLSQAEAVSEIVSSSNKFQLDAAEKLLEGKLLDKVSGIAGNIIDLMSMLEAELDFCDEGTMFISSEDAGEKCKLIADSLTNLLESNIRYEALIGLPSVGIAGSPNAGKSCLLNTLTGQERSIVSGTRATTRDILTEYLTLQDTNCVLFDCAGLSIDNKVDELDEIAQVSAIEAINTADLVIFCIAMDSENIDEDIKLFNLIKTENIIYIATKSDLFGNDETEQKLSKLSAIAKHDFMPISSESSINIDGLKSRINANLVEAQKKLGGESESVAVNQRHRQAIEKALKCVEDCNKEIASNNYELGSMYLRDSYETLMNLEQEKSVDEQMLDRIFSKFCIGK